MNHQKIVLILYICRFKWVIIFLFHAAIISAQEVPEREIHYRYGDWISFPVMRYVTSITVDHQYTYFGTTHGISRYNFYDRQWDYPFTVSDGLEDDYIRVLAYDFNSGFLWCATDAGLSYRVDSAEEWRNISYRNLDVDVVTSIGYGREFLWIEGEGRLYRADRLGYYFTGATEEEAFADGVRWSGQLKLDRDQPLLDLFIGHGYLFNPEGIIIDPEMREYDIVDFYYDDFFNLWIATWGLGASIANTRTFYLEFLPYGIYASNVNAMAWDEMGMWIGGHHQDDEESGITWWDMERDEWRYYEAKYITYLRNDNINAIISDEKTVYFGTMDGLAVYQKEKDIWQIYSVHDNLWDNRVTSLALGDGVLWVGTEYGLNRITLPSMIVEQVRDEKLIHRCIYQIEVDEESVWIATDRGIVRYNGNEDDWDYIPNYPGMLVQEVTAISVWNNEVWFGTDDGIEVYYKPTGQWKGFPADQYEIDRQINVILADSLAVWVGTENGVLKYHKEEDRWRRFTTVDGLLDDSLHWILLDGDYVWFGTNRGLTRFYWNAPYRID